MAARNAYTGAHWKKLRELRKDVNALLREQREIISRVR